MGQLRHIINIQLLDIALSQFRVSDSCPWPGCWTSCSTLSIYIVLWLPL